VGSLPEDVGGLPVPEIARRVKVELRDRMRRLRRTIGDDVRAQKSAKIAERVLALDVWQRAHTVMLFFPMRAEVDVRHLERAARLEGKTVAGPRMIDDGRTLEIRRWDEGAQPEDSGRMGVLEPPGTAALVDPSEIDLVIVPALALDPSGGRLGYGAGLYDRLLATLPTAISVGIAFDFQLLAEVPETPGDVRVHVVVTDTRTLVTGAKP
jgi:5-formyltetrahydrofolate cyclo-ligase